MNFFILTTQLILMAMITVFPLFKINLLPSASFSVGFLIVSGIFLCLVLVGIFQMKTAFKVAIEPKKSEAGGFLVRGGLYALSRNPIYVAGIVSALFWSLAWSEPIMCILTALLVLILHCKTLREERYLITRFGKPYLEYCKNVRRYF